MEQKEVDFIFNHQKMGDVKHLKDRLDTINKAVRRDDKTTRKWVNDAGRECYFLDTKGTRDGSAVMLPTSYVRTLDVLTQGDTPHRFSVHTLQMNYTYYVLDGEDKQRWIQNELEKRPDRTEDDIRFIEVYRSVLDSCTIYNGKIKLMEYHYGRSNREGSELRRSLSAAGILYLELQHELAFQPLKKVFFNQMLTTEDRQLLSQEHGSRVLQPNISPSIRPKEPKSR